MLVSVRVGEESEGADEMPNWHTMGYPRKQRISVFHGIVVSLAPRFVG